MLSFLPNVTLRKVMGIITCLFIVLCFLFITPSHVRAADPTPTPTTAPDAASAADGKWVEDPEVTFVGKTATRSDEFLNWALQNYDWLCVQKDANGNCDNANNPLTAFWILVRNTVYVLMVIFVLVTAFIMIITRGQNITIMKFIPRFIFIIILVTLSFSVVQFIYQISDIIQGFLYRIADGNSTRLLGSQDLLHIAFDYVNFEGFRRVGGAYEESAFISLLLVRLTAFTYYTMTGILLIRKIILWFFIILSPIFPLLLFYAPIRNTAKVWIGEFFRWLLYGPLFALLLHGLVVMWQTGIPLPFDFSKVGSESDIIYPTAVNILLGGPGQKLGITNSVNLKDTFALYVVALLMLWVVILLPFLLLNIFLDYLNTVSIRENPVFKQLVNRGMTFLNPRYPTTPPPPGTPPPAGAGIARALPFLSKGDGIARTIPVESPQQISNQAINIQNIHSSSDVMRLTNLAVPKMRDIAKYESALISRDTSKREEVSRVSSTLQHIANPTLASSPAEREKFSQLKEKLVQQKQRGDPLATSILQASSTLTNNTITNNSTSSSSQGVSSSAMSSTTNVHNKTENKTMQAGAPGGSVGGPKSALGTKNQTMIKQVQQANLPVVNRVQQVSLEDYEEVRKMWVENYQNLQPPKGMDGTEVDRKTWIKNDMDRINQATTLLTSIDPEKNKEGMNMVANILPFLLIGGFSRSEVIAYLKAKLEAGKSVLDNTAKKDEEEDTMVARDEQKQEQAGAMHEQEALPGEEKKTPKYLDEEKTEQ